MAVSYVSQKCTSCASTRFKFIKEENMWECMYCGTKIERQEQADTMFTIKNVVRQVLVDVAWRRFDSALGNIVECEKIDSRYIGTIIARIAYNYNMFFYGELNKAQMNNTMAQIKNDLKALHGIAQVPNDDELALYDFLDSSEAAGVLLLAFDALKDSNRSELMFEYYEPDQVYSMPLNSQLIVYSVKRQKYDLFDKIIENENIDPKKVLGIILNHYPDNDQKAENAEKMINAIEKAGESVKDRLEGYLNSSEDSPETKCDVCVAADGTASFPGFDFVSPVIAALSDFERIKKLVDAFAKRKMLDTELYKMIDFSLGSCGGDVCLYIFDRLSASDNFVQLNYDHLYRLLVNDFMAAEDKKKVIEIAKDMNLNDKIKDKCLSAYLTEINDTPEARQLIIPALLEITECPSVNTVEKYLLLPGVDDQYKIEVTEKLFSLNIPIVLFKNSLSRYLFTKDEYKVKYEIIDIMIKKGIRPSVESCFEFLQDSVYDDEQKVNIMYKLKEGGLDMNELYQLYVTKVDARKFSSSVHSAMIGTVTTVSEAAFIRYVLWLGDAPAAKAGYVEKLKNLSMNPPETISCSVMYDGMQIVCNLIQGYFFTAREEINTAAYIIEALGGSRRTFDIDMLVNGSNTNFFKFIKGRNSRINERTAELARVCRLI